MQRIEDEQTTKATVREGPESHKETCTSEGCSLNRHTPPHGVNEPAWLLILKIMMMRMYNDDNDDDGNDAGADNDAGVDGHGLVAADDHDDDDDGGDAEGAGDDGACDDRC